MNRIRTIVRHGLVFSFLMGIALVPLVFSPFGIDLTDRTLNYRILQVLMSPFYDVKESNEVLAIIVTDETVDAMEGQSWPIDYERHGDFLATIMQFEPCAIVLDVNFSQRRMQDGTLGDFIALLDEAKQDYPLRHDDPPNGNKNPCLADGEGPKEIPLIAAVGGRETLARRENVPRYNEALFDGPMIPAVSAWPPSNVNYPLIVNKHAEEPGPPQMTLAMRAFYETRLKRNADREQPWMALEPFQDDIFLQWGYDTPVYDEKVAFAFEGRVCRKNQGWAKNLLEVVCNPDKWLKLRSTEFTPAQPCPPIRQMDARNLLPQYWPGSDFLETMIKGKVIVYGANIASYPDLYESPVHGALPALFYHAIALDNLLAKEQDYLKFQGTKDNLWFEPVDTLLIDIGIVVIFGAVLYWMSWRQNNVESWIRKEIDDDDLRRNPRPYRLWASQQKIALGATTIHKFMDYFGIANWVPVLITAFAVTVPFFASNTLPFEFVGAAVSTFLANLTIRLPLRRLFGAIASLPDVLGRLLSGRS